MINENIKACLFDLDGVIVFTDKYHYLAWKKVSDRYGWDFNESVNNRLRGVSRAESLNIILRHNNTDISDDEKQRIMKAKNDLYIELLQNINDDDIYPGSIEFLKNIHSRGIKTALCSSSKNAEMVLNALGIKGLFDEIVTGNDIKHTKPDPEIFTLAAEKLRIPAFHCVVFEDSLAGIQGATAAGMKTVGVGNRVEVEECADEFIEKYDSINIDTFIESGKKAPFTPAEFDIIEPPYKKREERHIESMFALVNGYMGVRGTYDESYDEDESAQSPGMFINGVYETEPIHHPWYCNGFAENEQYTVNLADWRIVNVYVDGEKAGFSKGKMLSHNRVLDMKHGVLKREFVWESESGKQIKVNSIRIVNMTREHSAEVKYTVTPINFDGEIKLESVVVKTMPINGKDATENVCFGAVDDIKYIVTRTKTTDIKIAAAIKNVFKTDSENVIDECFEENKYIFCAVVNAERGIGITLEKYVSFFTSEDDKTQDIIRMAADSLRVNLADSFDKLYKLQCDFWEKHWESGDIKINGNLADQQAVRFNLFQLRQQLPTSGKTSIGATGLTGPVYSGKVFWDTEMYIMPYLNYIDPKITKPLLMYRYNILDKARERAQQMDGDGAMYSWCSINGEETSVVFEASTAEYHLQPDIAFAIKRYYLSSGDDDFMNKYGNEIVFETAKYMLGRGEFVEAQNGKFCINAVCGPDEYACGVNNNFYTNFMTKNHFEFAVDMYEHMQKEFPNEFEQLSKKIGLTPEIAGLWKKAADNMYYRYNEDLGIYEQDDSFVRNNTVDMELIPKNFDIRKILHPLNLWRIQVLKQADVLLLMFTMGDLFTADEKKRNYEYYEPKTNHGSSLSAAVHSIIAAETGKNADAYAYFRSAAYMDISDFKHNTDGGIHAACLGGVWMSVVNGFLGMRDYDKGLIFAPSIPKAWESVETKINYRGSVIGIKADKAKTVYTLLSGKSLRFTSGDMLVELSKTGESITVNNL